ncbi:MAG: YHYH protein [Isosphaeraceae bacterium]|nr:YHYH protein [Isosphaeraceae bacterium]
MGNWSRRRWMATGIAGSAAVAGTVWTFRSRSATGPSEVRIAVEGDRRVVTSNGLPGHATGDFPNRHDPVSLRVQSHRFEMPSRPEVAAQATALGFWNFGVAINGVPFDPSGPFWDGDAKSGWQFEVMCPPNALALGIDVNHAHTQGRGVYHYHGLPTALVWDARSAAPEAPMHLIGFAGDGFPIYAPDAPGTAEDLASPVRRLRSSWRLRLGKRSGGPGGAFDGTFVEDFEYRPGSGDLDECNGRVGPTPEFPDGIYHYVLTDEFPFIPRSFRGRPDPSFRHGPPPGVSPPVPSELRRYRPKV